MCLTCHRGRADVEVRDYVDVKRWIDFIIIQHVLDVCNDIKVMSMSRDRFSYHATHVRCI